jgi:hypothetical protein
MENDMDNCINDECSCDKLEAPRRNNYFYGKLLDDDNLRLEQTYLNRKRWMLNRLALGKGVVCGLNVTWTQDRVRISPGVAIDGCGREIVVPEPIEVNPWQTTDDCGRSSTLLAIEGVQKVFFCLAFVDCPTDYTPVLVTDCDSPDKVAPSTIVEKYAVIVKLVTQDSPQPLPKALDSDLCGALSGADPEVNRENVCSVLSARACADDASNSCVVIASGITLTDDKISAVDVCSERPVVYTNPELFEMLLCRSNGGGAGPAGPAGAAIDAVEVTKLDCDKPPWANLVPDTNNPPNQILELGIPTCCDDTLTKIKDINWPHDGSLDWAAFERDGLQIDFSGPVAVEPAIDDGWILVSFEISGGERTKPTDPTALILSLLFRFIWPPGTRLIYRLQAQQISLQNDTAAPRYFARFQPAPELTAYLVLIRQLFVQNFNLLCRVVVKCDFLVDGNGKPIDGDFLTGSLPSGDGMRGGEFESWFKLGLPEPPGGGGTTSTTAQPTLSALAAHSDALNHSFPGIAELANLLKVGN